MKNALLFFSIVMASCCGTKKSANTSAEIPGTETGALTAVDAPDCIKEMINIYIKEGKQNPPRKIFRYSYKEKTVYYVTPPCCDFFSELYDNDCKLIGHPDGGITGRGDGKLTDFEKTKTNGKLVWEDTRK